MGSWRARFAREPGTETFINVPEDPDIIMFAAAQGSVPLGLDLRPIPLPRIATLASCGGESSVRPACFVDPDEQEQTF